MLQKFKYSRRFVVGIVISLLTLWYFLGPTIWCPARHYIPFSYSCRVVDFHGGTFLIEHLVLDYPVASYLSLQPKWGFGHKIMVRLPYEVSPKKHSVHLTSNGKYQLVVDGQVRDIEVITREP